MLNRYRLVGRDGWKPDIETGPSPRSALNLHDSVVFPDDVTRRREPKTIAIGTGRKEWLENPRQRCFIHPAPGIGNRYDDEATGADPHLPDPRPARSPHATPTRAKTLT